MPGRTTSSRSSISASEGLGLLGRRVGHPCSDLAGLDLGEHRQLADPLHVVGDPIDHGVAVAAELVGRHVKAVCHPAGVSRRRTALIAENLFGNAPFRPGAHGEQVLLLEARSVGRAAVPVVAEPVERVVELRFALGAARVGLGGDGRAVASPPMPHASTSRGPSGSRNVSTMDA